MYFKNILVYLFSLGYPFFSISSTIYIYIYCGSIYIWIMSVNPFLLIYLSIHVHKKKCAFLKKEREGNPLPELTSSLTSITMSANKIRNENLAQGDEVTGWSMGERHPHTDSFTPITLHGEISSLSLCSMPQTTASTQCALHSSDQPSINRRITGEEFNWRFVWFVLLNLTGSS